MQELKCAILPCSGFGGKPASNYRVWSGYLRIIWHMLSHISVRGHTLQRVLGKAVWFSIHLQICLVNTPALITTISASFSLLVLTECLLSVLCLPCHCIFAISSLSPICSLCLERLQPSPWVLVLLVFLVHFLVLPQCSWLSPFYVSVPLLCSFLCAFLCVFFCVFPNIYFVFVIQMSLVFSAVT